MIKLAMPEASVAPPPPAEVKNPVSDPEDKEVMTNEIQSTKTVVERMTGSLLNARIKDKKLGTEPGSVENKILSAQSLGNITKKQIGEGIKFPGHGDVEEGDKIQGEPVYVNIGGKKVLVAEVQDCDEDEITVGFVDDDKPNVMSSERVSRQDMHDAMLVSERSAIEEGFSDPDQQALVRSHMDSLAAKIDPELPEPDYADELRDQAEKVAEAQGVLTAKDMKSFIDHFPEDAKQTDDVKRLLADLDGKVLLEPQDITRVIKTGVNPEQLGEKIIGLQDPINTLKQEVESLGGPSSPAGKIKQEELNALVAEQQVYANLREQLSGDSYEKMEDYFGKVQNGEIDPEVAKGVGEAFRSGNMDALFDKIPELKMDDTLTEDQKAAIKEKRKSILKKVGKGVGYTGLGLAALIALLAAAGIVMSASGMKSQG